MITENENEQNSILPNKIEKLRNVWIGIKEKQKHSSMKIQFPI